MDKRLSLCLVNCVLFAAALYFNARFSSRDKAAFVLCDLLISRLLFREALHGNEDCRLAWLTVFKGKSVY